MAWPDSLYQAKRYLELVIDRMEGKVPSEPGEDADTNLNIIKNALLYLNRPTEMPPPMFRLLADLDDAHRIISLMHDKLKYMRSKPQKPSGSKHVPAKRKRKSSGD